MLEENLQAVGFEAFPGEESNHVAKAGSEFCSISLIAIAECPDFSIQFRVCIAAAINAAGDGWRQYTPTATSSIFHGVFIHVRRVAGTGSSAPS